MDVTVEPTPIQTAITFLDTSKKGRSTLHGDLYHQRLALMIALRAYRAYQEGTLSDFMVAVEVESAGKFDDIMYFYQSSHGNGTFFIQAKHREKDGYEIVREAICTTADAKSAYAIPMYFKSFFAIDHLVPNNSRYVLCTNAELHENIKDFFKVIDPQQDNSLQFCSDIKATCYQFRADNQFPELIATLKDALLANLGNELAKTVFANKVITFKDTLINTFADFIYNCVVELAEETSESSESVYKFKPSLFKAAASTPEAKFRKAFWNEYKAEAKLKIDEKDLLELKIKINKESFISPRDPRNIGIFAAFDKKVADFYTKFVLVCNSMNEQLLDKELKTLLPQSFDAEREKILNKLQINLLKYMSSTKPVPINPKMLQYVFQNIEGMTKISTLKYSSAKYLESLHDKYLFLEIDPKTSQHSQLHTFLKDGLNCGVYEFCSSLTSTVSGRILDQILSYYHYETVLVNSTEYPRKETMMEILETLLEYFKFISHPKCNVVTILGEHTDVTIDELKKLSDKYHQKIIWAVSSKTAEHFEQFSGKVLTAEAWNKFFEQPVCKFFGTDTPLSMIVDRQDDLTFLVKVLELCHPPGMIEEHNLNMKSYQRIEDWYVQRKFKLYAEKEKTKTSNWEFEDIFEPENEESAPGYQNEGSSHFNKNVCILLNDSGYGKSWYFTWLAWRLSSCDASLYIVKLIANEYSTDFDQLHEENSFTEMNDTQLVRLLYRYIHLALFVPNINKRSIDDTNVDRNNADRCAKLLSLSNGRIVLDKGMQAELTAEELIELRLFRAKFNERKLVLILDGFDEVAPDYKDVVLHCFSQFVKLGGVQCLYLSSRPFGFEEDLKKTFHDCEVYELEPFSFLNIYLSWHKFLLRKLEGYKTYTKDHCIDILISLYKNLKDQMKEIVTVPLLLHMLQTILLPEIATRVTPYSHTISSNIWVTLNLDRHQLVTKFINMQLDILNIDKTGTTDAAIKTTAAKQMVKHYNTVVKEQQMLLAMYVIFNKTDRNLLLFDEDQQRGPTVMKEVNEGDEKAGFVLGVVNEIPRFVHRIFAEYFAACWLYQHRIVFRKQTILKSRTFFQTDAYRQTRYFFDCMLLKDDCVLHRALLNRLPKLAKEILRNNPSAITTTDEAGRLPIHLTNSDNQNRNIDLANATIHRAIIEHTPSRCLNTKDDLYGWNTLDYALLRTDGPCIKELLRVGVELNVDNLIQQLITQDPGRILSQVLDYILYLPKQRHVTDAIDNLCERVAIYLIHEKQANIHDPLYDNLLGYSMLDYCVERRSAVMLNQLLTQSGQQEHYFDAMGESKLNYLVRKRYFNIVHYIINHRCSLVAMIVDEHLFECGVDAINENLLEIFRKYFDELCTRRNIDVNHSTIINDYDDQRENRTMQIQLPYNVNCCAKQKHSFTAAKEAVNSFPLTLLAKAIDEGRVSIASYIVQKTGMIIDLEIVSQLSQCFRFREVRWSHSRSIPAFKYLFSKLNLDQDGPNLFDFIVKNGCLHMLPSLFDLAFDPNRIDVERLSELLNQQEDDERMAHLFEYLHKQQYVDCFIPFNNGESLFDIADRNNKLIVTEVLLKIVCN